MITNCRSCDSKDLKDILSLGKQYLSDFVDMDQVEKPPQHSLDVVMCNDCTLLQLKETTPSSSLYNDHYGYRSGINQTMREHLAEIVREASKRVALNKGDVVVDIGANDGTLISNYTDDFYRVGFEPVPKLAFECEKHASLVVNDFFGADEYFKQVKDKAKIITAISMFYDLHDPNSFVADLASILHSDGVLVIQQNYLVGMLQQKAFDNICHEHLEYYSLKSLEPLLNRHGLEVFEVQMNDLNGGSFRTYVRHMDSVKKMRLMEHKLRLDDKNTYDQFAGEVESAISDLHEFIAGEVKKGKTVYVYGASTRGNTILQAADIDNTLVKYAVERNPGKWGKKIASLDIPIISEEQARKEKPDYGLILPWFFWEEMKIRYQDLIDEGVEFIIPLPVCRLVTRSGIIKL